MSFLHFLDKLKKDGNDSSLPPIDVAGSAHGPAKGARIPRPPQSIATSNQAPSFDLPTTTTDFQSSQNQKSEDVALPPLFRQDQKQDDDASLVQQGPAKEPFSLPRFDSPLDRPDRGGDISPRIKRHKVQGPLFVKVDDYRRIMADLDLILNDLKESNNLIVRLNSIKNGLDTQFDRWHSEMEDLQRKLVFIDKTLFEELF